MEHRVATDRLGVNGHRELHTIFDQTPYARAIFADDRLIALGGIAGDLASPFGFVWIAVTDEAKRYPLAIVKEAKRVLDEGMRTKHELATTIIGGDETAKRFAVFLGFHVAHGGPGQQAYSRFGRRDLVRYLDSEPEVRIPVGNGFAIAMGYHGAMN